MTTNNIIEQLFKKNEIEILKRRNFTITERCTKTKQRLRDIRENVVRFNKHELDSKFERLLNN